MKIMQRVIQRVKGDKQQEFAQWEKAWQAVNERLGGPPKRYYTAIFGPEESGTVIWEREFQSVADLEAYREKVSQDPRPEIKALGFEAHDIVAMHRSELYQVLDLS